MKVNFAKYHGTGNDFILVDGRDSAITLDETMIQGLCDRHFGIGADGLIIMRGHEKYDFKMEFYNSDGRPGSMCGNGGRCITAFAKASGLPGESFAFEGPDGIHASFILPDGRIKLSLRDVSEVKRMKQGIYSDTGSPHLVRFVEDVVHTDVDGLGAKYRHDGSFPGGINVNFVEPEGSVIHVRTFERGVEAETLSCGTGVTAAALAAFYDGKIHGSPVEVHTRGGNLDVEFSFDSESGIFGSVFLTGPVTRVFEGVFEAVSK